MGLSCGAFGLLVLPGIASAAWNASTGGGGAGRSLSMPRGAAPTIQVQGRNVVVTWTTARLSDGAATAVGGYEVRRYSASSGVSQPVGASCTGTITALTCSESGVPSGSWRYGVVTRQGGWSGAESVRTDATVGAPTVTLAATSLDNSAMAGFATTTATVSNFLDGEVVSFRLGAASGTQVGSTTAGTGGGASATITVPYGTAVGANTIVAVGAGGSSGQHSMTITAATRSFVVTPSTTTPGAGGALTLSVQATVNGQNDSALSGTRTLAVSGLSSAPNGTAATAPTLATFNGTGLATISVTPVRTGSATVSLAAPTWGHAGSTTLNVRLGVLASLTFTNPSTVCGTNGVTVGNAGSWSSKVTAFDALGNGANPGAAISVALTGTGNGSVTPPSLSIATGATPAETGAAFTVTLPSGGNRTFTVKAAVGAISVSCAVKS